MNGILQKLFAILALGVGAADIALAAPTTILLRSDKACTMTVVGSPAGDYELNEATAANDGGTWYGSARVWATTDLELTASVTGYATAWYSYDHDVTLREEGPSSATKLLGTGSSLAMGTMLDELCTNSTAVGLAYAQFTPITYSVAYNLAGGRQGEYHPVSATYDTAFTVSAPTREGYSFAGWQVGGKTYFEGETADVTLVNLTAEAGANVTLTALWTPRQYVLTLTVNTGIDKIYYKVGTASQWVAVAATTPVPVDYDSVWSAYAEPAYGYVLSGTGSSKDSPYSGTMGTGGAIFEPKPTKAVYRVTITSNPSEAGTTKGDGNYTYGDQTTIEATAKTGWYFVNWSDGDRNNPHTLTVTSTTNIWANFKKYVYNVVFVYRGSTGVEVRESQSVEYGDSAVAPTSDKYNCYPGNRFDKWDNNAWGTVTGDLLINAIYIPNTYTVKFNGNGATAGTVNDQSLTYGTEQALSLNRYGRTGYFFKGWSADPSGATGELYTDEQRVKDIVKAADGTMRAQGATLTLYAQWEPIHYTIRFDPNGATAGSMGDQVVAYDAAVSLTSNKFSHVQEFLGWTGSDGRSYGDGEVVSRLTATDGATFVMKAQWTKVGTIRFHRNDGGEDITYKQSVEKDVEAALLPNAFTRTGYTFEGWTNSASAYAEQELVKDIAAPGETTELYAKWKPITYDVQFNANGGSGKMAQRPLTYDVGETIANEFGVPADGWSFVGWGTNTTEVLVAAGAEVKNLTSINGDHVRLYAIWGANFGEWTEYLRGTNSAEKLQLFIEPEDEKKWEKNTDKSGKLVKSIADPASIMFSAPCDGDLTFTWGSFSEGASFSVTTNGVAVYSKDINAGERVDVVINGITKNTKVNLLNPTNTGTYCCFIRNMQWVPRPVAVTTKEVAFDIGECGHRIAGGEANQTVVVGEAALEPTVLAAPGWTFTGWDSRAFTNVTADLSVKATHARTNYKLIYANTNDKVNPNATSFVATNAFTFAPLQDSMGNVAAGFEGWSPSALIQGTTSNLVVTAKWKAVTAKTHKVTYVSGTAGGTTNIVEIADGKNAAWPEATQEAGWAFVGWDKSTDAVTGDVVVRARYEVIDYPVVYKNMKGVEHSNPLSYNISSEFNLTSPLNRDTRLMFVGWTPTDRLKKGMTGEHVFTANWAYWITCKCGAHVRAGSDPLDFYVAEGGSTNAPNVTIDVGYRLDGWYGADGKKVESPFTNIAEAVTYTAVAKPIEYAITYEGLEGATHTNPSTFTVEDDVSFTAPSARDGYVFTGWEPAGIARGTADNVTTRATWRSMPKQTFPVVIDGAVGTYEYGSNVVAMTVASVTNGMTNVVCTGWVGTGDVPKTGTSNRVSFVVTQASSLVWQHATNYYVSVSAGEGGKASLTDASGQAVAAGGWFAAGAKLTAEATADTGWLFKEWVDAKTGKTCGTDRALALPVAGAVAVRATFEAESPTPPTPVVTNLTVGAWAFTGNVTELEAEIQQGVNVVWPVTASEGKVSVSGLPGGLKYKARELSVSGSPTTAKKYTTKFTVSTKVGRLTVKTVYKLVFTVKALPGEIVGKYVGGSTGDSAGAVELTVAKTGKITGKWKAEGKNWTLAATGFDGVDEATGAYRATVTAKSGRVYETTEVLFGTAVVEAGAFHGADTLGVAGCELFDATCVNWKSATWKGLAAMLKKAKFDVTDDKVTLAGTVGASGSVTVKGSFDVGTTKPYAASAKGTLVPLGKDAFELFLYYPPKKNKFDGWSTRLVLRWNGEALEVVE